MPINKLNEKPATENKPETLSKIKQKRKETKRVLVKLRTVKTLQMPICSKQNTSFQRQKTLTEE